MKNLREFGILFATQLISYCLFCLSMIVVTRGSYVWTVVTDTLFGLNSFFIIKRIAAMDQKNPWGVLGYTLGGTCGSLLAIWITKKVSG